MPRDFDAEEVERYEEKRSRWEEEGRDRSFTLGGEDFEYSVRLPAKAFMALFSVDGDMRQREVWARVTTAAPLLIDLGETEEEQEETRARWDRAVQNVEYETVQSVVFWIVEEHFRRPTEASVASGNGRSTTEVTSTATSSSTADEVSPS